jgi:aspartate 1-decarboxylase
MLLEEADIRPCEAVHVWNIKNGARLETVRDIGGVRLARDLPEPRSGAAARSR